jgi:trk system potassium uptake protein TrkH
LRKRDVLHNGHVGVDTLHRIRRSTFRRLTPSRIFILSFALLILIGAVLLRMPFASSGSRLSFVDALFTAASAVCVTGLAVIDIGKDLSFAGQVITLLLFQIGGLGIITFSVVLFGLMGRGISFRGREIVQSTFLHTPRSDFFTVVKGVIKFTFVIEVVGTLLLFIRFSQDFPPAAAFFHALYNAVSAFNNCGYSLFSDSLIQYQGDWIVNLTVMGLIVLGGIGFIVQNEVIGWCRGLRKKLSLHSKIVLLTSGILILSGAALFYFFEMDHILKGATWQTQLLASFFQSITPRTAGFNTVDIGRLTNDTILIMIILMFIGASPGSTGGGIKTTSFALLLLMIWNRMKGSHHVNAMNRQIPGEILDRTISIIFASAFSVCLITSVLLFFCVEGDLPPDRTRNFFVEYLFETVSAFGTVGLSMGVTPKLNDIQKLAIVLMMFAGRVGPLTLAFSWYSEGKKKIKYAEESIMVG